MTSQDYVIILLPGRVLPFSLYFPVNNISVKESYQRFCSAMQKAARHSIPRGFRPTYTPCLDKECQDLLKQYEESGDPDIADHLIESLDAARRHRWEELIK